jgi:hypothetical protein
MISHQINHHNQHQQQHRNHQQNQKNNKMLKSNGTENWFCDYIELEKFYKKVDRTTCEELLGNRIDGSCLVRPYKEMVCEFLFKVFFFAKVVSINLPTAILP